MADVRDRRPRRAGLCGRRAQRLAPPRHRPSDHRPRPGLRARHGPMSAGPAVTTIAHQIQLAVAPVFLLAGIGSILNVLAGRLARVVERARQLEREFSSFDDETRAAATAELHILDRRMTVVNLALSACTSA